MANEEWVVDTEIIARELRAADAKRSSSDRWVIEIGFWISVIVFLTVLWALTAGIVIGPWRH